MKKNYVAIILLLSAILLCGCEDNDGPEVNTNTQQESQSDSLEHGDNSWEVSFDSIGKVLRAVDEETYSKTYENAEHAYCIISSQAEWLYWTDENIPGWNNTAGIDIAALDWEKDSILVSETTQTSKGTISYINPVEKIIIQNGRLVVTHSGDETSELVK